MADFGTPVANQIQYNPQQGMQTLGTLYGIQSAKAQAQQQTQTAGQRYGIAQWVKSFDPSKHVASDGTLDLNAVLADPGLRQAAGDAYPEMVQQFIQMKQGQLQNKQALINVNDSARKGLQDIIGSFRGQDDTPDTRQALHEAVGQYAASGPDAARIAGIYEPQIDNVPQGKLHEYLSNIQLQAEDASTQAANMKPAYQPTGKTLKQTNEQAVSPEGGKASDLTVTIPPGYATTKDAAGNVIAYNEQNPRDAFVVGSGGGKESTSPKPSGPAAPSPGYKPPAISGIGDVENKQQSAMNDEDLYNKVILPAGNKAPVIKSALLNLEKLSDSGVLTGTGTENLSQIEGLMGQFGLKGAGDAAKDRQLMTKYTQQLAMQLTESNYGTDAARGMVEHAIPNPDNMTPEAMKQAAQYVYGQQQIAEARANLANQFKQKNGSTVGLRQMDSQFMQNVDPRMFDMVGMTPQQQQDYVKNNFKSKQEWDDFKAKMAVINHLGGFNPSAAGATGSF